MAIGNKQLKQECFPITHAWEHQEWKKTKEQKKVKREMSMERRKARMKKKKSQWPELS